VLIARQRARQIAGLLGFDESQRGAIAAAVFEMACRDQGRGMIRFHLSDDTLHVGALEFALPDPDGTPPRPDIPWLVQTLDQITPFSMFEEIEQQNRDLLRALRKSGQRHAA
jgi:hypothetical protein